MGLAIWESEESFQASVHLAREAVADDPFDVWEAEPVVGFRLTEAQSVRGRGRLSRVLRRSSGIAGF